MVNLGITFGAIKYFSFDVEAVMRRQHTNRLSYPMVFIHVVFGSLWIFSGLAQFTNTFQRNKKWHKINGYFYYGFTLLSVLSLFAVGLKLQAGAPFKVGVFPNSLHTLISLVLSFIFIKYRNIEMHRAWVIRSMIMGLIMPVDRFFSGLYLLNPVLRLSFSNIVIVTLIIAELIIHRKLKFKLHFSNNMLVSFVTSIIVFGLLAGTFYYTFFFEINFVDKTRMNF